MVNRKRVERFWRQEGLKVRKEQPGRGREIPGSGDPRSGGRDLLPG
jgi:hypothetical protein